MRNLMFEVNSQFQRIWWKLFQKMITCTFDTDITTFDEMWLSWADGTFSPVESYFLRRERSVCESTSLINQRPLITPFRSDDPILLKKPHRQSSFLHSVTDCCQLLVDPKSRFSSPNCSPQLLMATGKSDIGSLADCTLKSHPI
jgi:hypothetical protein